MNGACELCDVVEQFTNFMLLIRRRQNKFTVKSKTFIIHRIQEIMLPITLSMFANISRLQNKSLHF